MRVMKRREFVSRVPALAAGVAVGGAVGVAEASSDVGGHEGASEGLMEQEGSGGASGFRLVGNEGIVVPVLPSVRGKPGEDFALCRYVVECPYPVGSRAWFAVGDRDGDDRMLVYDETDPLYVYVRAERTRRVLFPRFVAEEGEDLRERARMVHEAATVHGFDDVPADGREWMVVHVEYRCPDGVEHVMVGMPLMWNPRLALGVMVRGQIG